MSPYILAIAANTFWACVNIIDKYLVERFCKDGSIGALLVLSSLFPVTLMPLAYWLADGDILTDTKAVAILIFSGTLTTAWLFFYFRALFDDSVSRVIPLLQLSPVFSLIFGIFILNEIPLPGQLVAGAIIVTGSIVLSYEKSKARLKISLLWYMLAAASIIALMNTLFKLVALGDNFWSAIFWHATGTTLAGVCLFFCNRSYRLGFIRFIKDNWGVGLTLNGVNESLTISGDIIFAYAILLAPLALVHAMEGFQPLIVLLIASVLTKLKISYFTSDDSDGDIGKYQLMFGILIVVLGGILLTVTSS